MKPTPRSIARREQDDKEWQRSKHKHPVTLDPNDSPCRCYCVICQDEYITRLGDVPDNAPSKWVEGHRGCRIWLCEAHRHLAQEQVYKPVDVPKHGQYEELDAMLERGRSHITSDPETAAAEFLFVLAKLVLEQAKRDTRRAPPS